MLWRILDIWDCLWYYSRGKVKTRVFYYGDGMYAFASNGFMSVYNCYGSTSETAKEMALYRLRLIEAINEEQNGQVKRFRKVEAK